MNYPREKAFTNWAWTMAGIFYIGWTLSYWIDLRLLDTGRDWVFCFISIIIANDIGAYFIGKKLGKHRMAPSISPHKTWEGAIGGLLCGILVALIFGVILALPKTYLHMISLGIFISIFAQIGDLVESLLKRNAGVKDASKLVPGHGGVLDRCDSLVLTAPVFFHVVRYLHGA